MHEVSLVAELVDACVERAAGRPVDLVRIRHASTIPDEVLHQAFAMLTEGGEMAGATLETEAFDIWLRCACGFAGSLGHDDLVDAVAAICPACGDVSPRRRTAEIELLEVRLAAQA